MKDAVRPLINRQIIFRRLPLVLFLFLLNFALHLRLKLCLRLAVFLSFLNEVFFLASIFFDLEVLSLLSCFFHLQVLLEVFFVDGWLPNELQLFGNQFLELINVIISYV